MKFHISKSIVIDASMKKVRELIEDFRHWPSWSPWNIVEPDCKMSYKGKAGEIGHEMAWDGKVIGSGTNTIVEINENMVRHDLRFIKPHASQSSAAMITKKTNKGIKVTWTMDGSMPFFLFFMIPKMKAWIGMDYDRGLRMLKAIAEKGSIDAKTTSKGITNFEGFSYVGIQNTCSMDKLPETMSKDFEKLVGDIVHKHGKGARHWVCLYPKMDMKNMTMTYIAAVSDEDLSDIDLGDKYVSGTIESGKVFEIHHRGSYEFMGNAWSMGMMRLRHQKLKQKGVPFEYYWNSPYDVPPEKLKTSVYFPVK